VDIKNKHSVVFWGNTSGSALIVVVWVIGLLALLVSSFTFDAHIEARITSYYRNRTKAEYLAKSGIEMAELLMLKSLKANSIVDGDAEQSEWWYNYSKRLAQGLPIRGFEQPLGSGTITLDIVPEPARRNVNLLKEDDWERCLDVGGIPQEMWEGLIAAVFDWTDSDDTPRFNGAETEDYYEKLETPYDAKNGPLDTVGELLLVKGFTKAILSGGLIVTNDVNQEPVRISGIEDLLTTYGDGKVNVNAASQRVLMTLPNVDEIFAGAIIEEREGVADANGKKENTSYRDVNDLFARIPGLDPAVRGYVTTDSGIYRVTSIGTVHGVKRTVWCIVRYANKQMTILQWREED
jgi:general secretion pathway protein K